LRDIILKRTSWECNLILLEIKEPFFLKLKQFSISWKKILLWNIKNFFAHGT